MKVLFLHIYIYIIKIYIYTHILSQKISSNKKSFALIIIKHACCLISIVLYILLNVTQSLRYLYIWILIKLNVINYVIYIYDWCCPKKCYIWLIHNFSYIYSHASWPNLICKCLLKLVLSLLAINECKTVL